MQPLAAFLALGQMLEEQAARDGAAVRPLGDPDAEQTGDLLRLDEIALGCGRQRFAVERHDALIAFTGSR